MSIGSQVAAPLRSRKAHSLLGLLVLRHGTAVDRKWLSSALWPDSDQEQAYSNLRPILSELRKALGPQSYRLSAPNRHTVQLDLTGASADIIEFDLSLVRKSPLSLVKAVSLYRGSLLDGSSEDWIVQERDKRANQCLVALHTLADLSNNALDYDSAIDFCRRAVAMAPLRDSAYRTMMQILARKGDINSALHIYRQYAAQLHSDPRAVPDPATHDLYLRLRADLQERTRKMATVAPAASIIPHYLLRESTLPPFGYRSGSAEDVTEVAAALRQSRLVTLTGVEGIGKTKLAIAVSNFLADSYVDGVRFISVINFSNADDVIAYIGSTFYLVHCDQQMLNKHFQNKKLLLLLDGCEHIVSSIAEFVGATLRACPEVRILATSREALGIVGEQQRQVGVEAAQSIDLQEYQRPKSYNSDSLLSKSERLLFESLSIFCNGWSLEAAEQVCGQGSIVPNHVLDLLTSLVDKSLVIFDQSERDYRARYRFLKPIKEEAYLSLLKNGTFPLVQARHRDWAIVFAEHIYALLFSEDPQEWYEYLDIEHDNILAALDRAIKIVNDPVPGLRLSGAMWPFWLMSDYVNDGLKLTSAALQKDYNGGATPERANALIGAGVLAGVQGDLAAADGYLTNSLSISRQIGDPTLVKLSKNALAHISEFCGDPENAWKVCLSTTIEQPDQPISVIVQSKFAAGTIR